MEGRFFFSRRLFTCDITAFFCVFCKKKLGGKGGLGQKFVKRHNGIPIRNNYTRFHEATSIGRGKKKIFCIFFKEKRKKNKLGGGSPKKIKTANSLGHKEYVYQVSLTYDDGKGKKNRGNPVGGSSRSSSRTRARRQNREFQSPTIS